MIYIIIGPDGSGKTSLSKKLSELLNYNIIHMDKPITETDKLNMFNQYINILNNNDNIILDRAWYCEMVYGLIIRNKSYINLEQMYFLENLIKNKAIIIYCTDITQNLWNRCIFRGEDYIKSFDILDKIKNKYDEIINLNHNIPIFKYIIDERNSI